MTPLKENREESQKLMGELMVFMSDFNEIEKTFSRIRNEFTELYEKLDKIQDDI